MTRRGGCPPPPRGGSGVGPRRRKNHRPAPRRHRRAEWWWRRRTGLLRRGPWRSRATGRIGLKRGRGEGGPCGSLHPAPGVKLFGCILSFWCWGRHYVVCGQGKMDTVPSETLYFLGIFSISIGASISCNHTQFSRHLHQSRTNPLKPIMPRALLRTQREHAGVALRSGRDDMENLAQEVGCCTSKMVKMRANMKRFDSVTKPKFVVQGRPRKITPAIEQVHRYFSSS